MPRRDHTDEHVTRWLPILPTLDPDIEGVVTRVQKLARHLRRVKEQCLVDLHLQPHEFETLHALAGRHGHAAPSEIAADLGMAPASVTSRLDTLHRRDFIRRTTSPTDRRRVDVELTAAGQQAWQSAIDVLEHEETNLLSTLDCTQRQTLNDLLRRIMLVAENPPH